MPSVVDDILARQMGQMTIKQPNSDGTVTSGNWLDFNPVIKNMISGLSEMIGAAPSARVVDRLGQLRSPLMRPQTPFEWADYGAGLTADIAQTALSGADLAGIAGAATPFARKMMQSQRGSIGDVDPTASALIQSLQRNEGDMAKNSGDITTPATPQSPKGGKFYDKEINMNENGDFYIYRGAADFSDTAGAGSGVYFSSDPWLGKKYADLYHGGMQRLIVNKLKLIDLRRLKKGYSENDIKKLFNKHGIVEDEYPSIDHDGKNILTYSENNDRLLYIAEKHGFDGYIGKEEGKPNILLTPQANKKYFELSEIENDPDAIIGRDWDDGDIPHASTPPGQAGK